MRQTKTPPYLSETKDGKTYIKVRLQPRASKNRVTGVAGTVGDERLKISLTSPPVDNAANASLITYLSKLLKTKKSNIVIKDGRRSRSKGVVVAGVTVEEVVGAVSKLL